MKFIIVLKYFLPSIMSSQSLHGYKYHNLPQNFHEKNMVGHAIDLLDSRNNMNLECSYLTTPDEEDYLSNFDLTVLDPQQPSYTINSTKEVDIENLLDTITDMDPTRSFFTTLDEEEYLFNFDLTALDSQKVSDKTDYTKEVNIDNLLDTNTDMDRQALFWTTHEEKEFLRDFDLSALEPQQHPITTDYKEQANVDAQSNTDSCMDVQLQELHNLMFQTHNEKDFWSEFNNTILEQQEKIDDNFQLHYFENQEGNPQFPTFFQQADNRYSTLSSSVDTHNLNLITNGKQSEYQITSKSLNSLDNVVHHTNNTYNISPIINQQQESADLFVQDQLANDKLQIVEENQEELCCNIKEYPGWVVLDHHEISSNVFKNISFEEFMFSFTDIHFSNDNFFNRNMVKMEKIYRASTSLLSSNIVLLKNLCSLFDLKIDVDSYFAKICSPRTLMAALTRLEKNIKTNLTTNRFCNTNYKCQMSTILINKKILESEELLVPDLHLISRSINKFKTRDLVKELIYCIKNENNVQINNIIMLLLYFYPFDSDNNILYDNFISDLIILIRITKHKSNIIPIDNIAMTSVFREHVIKGFGRFYYTNNIDSFLLDLMKWKTAFEEYIPDSIMEKRDDYFMTFICILTYTPLKRLKPFKFISETLLRSKNADEIRIFILMEDLLKDSISLLEHTNQFIINTLYRFIKTPENRLYNIKYY